MKYSIIDYEKSLTEKTVLMWRPSKKRAFGQKDIHSFNPDVQFIKSVLSRNNKIRIAIDFKTEKVLGFIAYTAEMVSQLYVDVEYLNLGIGTTLLKIAKEESNLQLELFVFQRNIKV